MDCSPPASSVYGILQARILEWVAIPFFRGSSWLRNGTQISHTSGRFFIEPPGKVGGKNQGEARELNKDLESKVCHANKLELDSASREKSSKIWLYYKQSCRATKESGTNFLWRNWRMYVDYRSLIYDILFGNKCYSNWHVLSQIACKKLEWYLIKIEKVKLHLYPWRSLKTSDFLIEERGWNGRDEQTWKEIAQKFST